MGKGLALIFKNKYPSMFANYRQDCMEGKVKIGFMHLWKFSEEDRWIVNFPTKNHWRDNSQLEWIVDGLKDLVKVIRDNKIKSLAIPALGCGLGSLQFSVVKKEIVKVCEDHLSDIIVEIYEPN